MVEINKKYLAEPFLSMLLAQSEFNLMYNLQLKLKLKKYSLFFAQADYDARMNCIATACVKSYLRDIQDCAEVRRVG